MNCKHVEELLPLYVGRDLEEKRASKVTAHVQTCEECARSAREYGEASQLLQMFEPPQFSEATFAAVRGSVLREIERESHAPQRIVALDFLRRAFQPRLMWAVSTAVLLAVSVLAYYFIANRMSGQRHVQPVAVKPAAGNQNPKQEPAIGVSPDDHSVKITTPDPNGTPGAPPAPVAQPHRPRFDLVQASRHFLRAGGAPAVPVTLAHYPKVESSTPTLNTSAASDKTLRLEIQTSDSNIRIIWFTHPSGNEGSPNESSKGI